MVVALVASTVERIALPVVARSQALLIRAVHPMFANTLLTVSTIVTIAVATIWILRATIFAPKKRAPAGAYVHSRIERDTATDGDGSSDDPTRPEYDVVIVGAGVVGSALAAVWGRSGARIALVERDITEPHRIVGELLQPSGVEKLKALGLYEALTGIDAQSVPGYGIVLGSGADERIIRLPYPDRPNGPEPDAAAPEQKYNERFTGRGLHNGRFVANLRRQALKHPNVKLIHGTVTTLLQRSDGRVSGVTYRPGTTAPSHTNGKVSDEEVKTLPASPVAAAAATVKVRAGLTVIVDGCLSAFRRPLFEPAITCKSKFLGLVLEHCVLPEPGCGNVILANPSPILVYPISATETRMLIDLPQMPDSDEALLRHLKTVVEPQLPPSVQPSFRAALTTSRIPGTASWTNFQSMPNQSLCTERPALPMGCLVVGDALNMRHPLTGGGMTVGFTDIELLRDIFTPATTSASGGGGVLNWHDHCRVHGLVSSFYDRRLGRSAVINILADALYQVFLAANPDLRVACFDYLSDTHSVIGKLCFQGPIALLSGLNRSQSRLVVHFFSVALYAVGRLWLRLEIRRGIELFRTACRIILPLLERENNYALVRAVHSIAKVAFVL